MKHVKRIEAEKEYKNAFAAWALSMHGDDEAARVAADSRLVHARGVLLAAEVAHPTKTEASKRARSLKEYSRSHYWS